MAELAPTPALPTGQTYRPISGLAIAGFALAVLSVGVFLLEGGWLLGLLPLPALVVSGIARYRIRRAEGTLAGYTLAGLGVAISLVTALVLITVNVTSTWIVTVEARDFLEQWLVKMREGKEGAAFLDTIPPDQRQVNFRLDDKRRLRAHYPSPANPDESMFDYFRKSQMSGMLLRYRDRVTYQYISVDEIKYILGSYYLKLRYHVTSPEAIGDFHFALRSDKIDTAAGPRREWRVEVERCIPTGNPPPESTPHGLFLQEVKRESGRALGDWLRCIAEGRRADAEKVHTFMNDAGMVAEFNRLYVALRRDTRPGFPATLVPKQSASLLLEDTNEGNAWALDYEGVIDTGSREVEFQFRIETDDPRKGKTSWRISRVKFLGEHRKIEQRFAGPGADSQ
jgi:hypothetical protein